MDQLRIRLCNCLKTQLYANGGFRLSVVPVPTNGYEYVHFEVISEDGKDVLVEIIDQGESWFQVEFKIKRTEEEYASYVYKYVELLRSMATVDISVDRTGCWHVHVAG